VISPKQDPEKSDQNTALTHGHFGQIAGKKSRFDGILRHNVNPMSFSSVIPRYCTVWSKCILLDLIFFMVHTDNISSSPVYYSTLLYRHENHWSNCSRHFPAWNGSTRDPRESTFAHPTVYPTVRHMSPMPRDYSPAPWPNTQWWRVPILPRICPRCHLRSRFSQ
jgi:hypothetical protein